MCGIVSLSGSVFRVIGNMIDQYNIIVSIVGLAAVAMLALALKNIHIETDVNKLWVEEDGRLEDELIHYNRHHSNTINYQILIQTSETAGGNIVSQEALSTHLNTLEAITTLEVDLYDLPWSVSDICYKTKVLSFEDNLIDAMLEKMIPCVIISPLDCFWDGGKLLGPERPVYVPLEGYITWKNLNPMQLVTRLADRGFNIPFDSVMNMLHQSGITSGYVNRPCLDNDDPECPRGAAEQGIIPHEELLEVLSRGCSGFATKLMSWPRELIMGGVTETNGMIQKVEAFQSMILLMGAEEFYEKLAPQYKVHDKGWSIEKAGKILDWFQNKITEIVAKADNSSSTFKLLSFSPTTLDQILLEFSTTSTSLLAAGFLVMFIYAVMRNIDPVVVRSRIGVACAGVVLVCASVAGGLGLVVLMGIHFNAASTQVLPFMLFSFGINDMFVILHASSELMDEYLSNQHTYHAAECLAHKGVQIVLTSLQISLGFFMSYIIPLPALRALVLQAGIVVVLMMLVNLIVFSAFVSVDASRQRSQRADLPCCFMRPAQADRHDTPQTIPQTTSSPQHTPPPTAWYTVINSEGETVTQCHRQAWPGTSSSTTDNTTPVDDNVEAANRTVDLQVLSLSQKLNRCRSSLLTRFASGYYATFIGLCPVKVVVVVLSTILVACGIWSVFTLENGIDLTDILPSHTREHDFLQMQQQYFPFYNMYLVTTDIQYPLMQAELYKIHAELASVDGVMKNQDGELPKFWLSLFRDWLLVLQDAFDAEWRDTLTVSQWHSNATSNAVIAYKLLAQTGDMSDPVDRQMVGSNRLVDDRGIINPSTFYNYLTAWVSLDPLAVATAQPGFSPAPPPYYTVDEYNMIIPRSPSLLFTQIPFYVKDLRTTEQFIKFITHLRRLCSEFSRHGLSVYPYGTPILYWQQYITIASTLWISMACCLASSFVINCAALGPWPAAIIVLVIMMNTVQLYGLLPMIGVRMSAIPAVSLISSIGIGLEPLVHVTMAFMRSSGTREQRVRTSLGKTLPPVLDSTVSNILGVFLLAFSAYKFIVQYFFLMFTLLVLLAFCNGVVLLPIILSAVGPPSQAVATATPSPPSSDAAQHYSHRNYTQPTHSSSSAVINSSTAGIYIEPPEVIINSQGTSSSDDGKDSHITKVTHTATITVVQQCPGRASHVISQPNTSRPRAETSGLAPTQCRGAATKLPDVLL